MPAFWITINPVYAQIQYYIITVYESVCKILVCDLKLWLRNILPSHFWVRLGGTGWSCK